MHPLLPGLTYKPPRAADFTRATSSFILGGHMYLLSRTPVDRTCFLGIRGFMHKAGQTSTGNSHTDTRHTTAGLRPLDQMATPRAAVSFQRMVGTAGVSPL